MENIILGIITLGALYFLYRKLFKTSGCDSCGGSCDKEK